MSNALRLLVAMCDALDLDIEEKYIFPDIQRTERDYIVTKKAKIQRKPSDRVYTDSFKSVWGVYPKRSGSNSKVEAFRAWNARLTEKENDNAVGLMLEGVERYANYIKATKQEGTQYVLQASTFFGPSKHYLNDWIVPEQEVRLKLPFTNEELPAFAKANNLPEAGRTENYTMYRKRLTDHILTMKG